MDCILLLSTTLMFDAEAGDQGQWRHIGRMKGRHEGRMGRAGHAVSPVNFNQIIDYCCVF